MESSESVFHKFDPNSCVLVVAIDFGTTYSGYGFSFKNQPAKVIVNKNWGEDIGTSSYKTPTCVLIDKKKEFVSFGYRAEYDYSRYCDEGSGDDYDLFKHFKMMLYKNQSLCRTAMINSTTGTEVNAIDIFAIALKFFKNHLLEELNRQTDSSPDENLIQWVLTIPAIWNDEAKQFMREAAFQANLIKTKHSKQLMFALEPEAASVYCRSEFSSNSLEATTVDFPPGTRYMIVDAGGGTIDITAHEIEENGDMIELICATGGHCGGNEVDKNFENYMTDILGQDFMEVYKRDCPSQWLDIMNNFERKKRSTNMDYEQVPKISISLPWSMAQKYKEETGENIEMILKNASEKGLVFKQGNIIMNGDTVRGFFKNIIDNIVNHIRETLQKEDLEILQYMVLVGGFSESKFLFHRLKEEFSSSVCKVISPQSANLSIIKGAVLFGHKPQIIAARRSRKTYGCGVDGPFIYGKHKPERGYTDIYGKLRCRGLFEVIASKGESVSLFHCKVFNFHTDNFTEVEVGTQIYATDRTDVMYADEHGLTKIGSIKTDVSQNRESRIDLEIRVYFGQTEIVIETENKNIDDGDIITSSIDFLDG